MKNLLFIFCFLFSLTISIQANNYEYLHGLKNPKDGTVHFEMSGYYILVSSSKGSLEKEKDLRKIKKKYEIKETTAEFSSERFNLANKVLEAEVGVEKNLSVKQNVALYLLQSSEKEIVSFFFVTLDQRDFVFEQDFVIDYLGGKLNSYISENLVGEYMNLAGRNIQLGNACGWMGPNNLYCKGGQISWSEFPSFERAEINLDNRIAANKRDNTVILSEDFVEIVFEDVPTIAYRVVYREKKNFYNYPSVLIVYYVCEEIRGHYISCILSHYGDNRADYDLPDLLAEFMSFPEKPYNAFNKYDIPLYEDSVTPEEKDFFDSRINAIELRLGSFIPLGNLQDAFVWAPSFDLFVGLPIKNNMAIDLRFSVAPPINRNPIDLYAEGERFSTKINAVTAMGVRYRYQMQLTKTLFTTLYGGAGVSLLATDLEKENVKKEEEEYYQITAFDIYGGVSLRHKRVGCFFEYRNPFYGKSNLVRQNFGNQMLQVGVFYTFY